MQKEQDNEQQPMSPTNGMGMDIVQPQTTTLDPRGGVAPRVTGTKQPRARYTVFHHNDDNPPWINTTQGKEELKKCELAASRRGQVFNEFVHGTLP